MSNSLLVNIPIIEARNEAKNDAKNDAKTLEKKYEYIIKIANTNTKNS